jgi:hypothetical protein
LNRLRSLAIVRDLVKQVLYARKNKNNLMYPDEDDEDMKF